MDFFIKIPLKYTNKTLKLLLPFISWNVYTKVPKKATKKDNFGQNTVCKSNKFRKAKKSLHLCCR